MPNAPSTMAPIKNQRAHWVQSMLVEPDCPGLVSGTTEAEGRVTVGTGIVGSFPKLKTKYKTPHEPVEFVRLNDDTLIGSLVEGSLKSRQNGRCEFCNPDAHFRLKAGLQTGQSSNASTATGPGEATFHSHSPASSSTCISVSLWNSPSPRRTAAMGVAGARCKSTRLFPANPMPTPRSFEDSEGVAMSRPDFLRSYSTIDGATTSATGSASITSSNSSERGAFLGATPE